MLILHGNICEDNLIRMHSLSSSICIKNIWSISNVIRKDKTTLSKGMKPHVHARNLISPAAGKRRSQRALLGTRLRTLHLHGQKKEQVSFAEREKKITSLPKKNILPSIDDLRIHFVQLVEASKYEFIFRKSIVRSLGLRLWIQHILIFLQIEFIQLR